MVEIEKLYRDDRITPVQEHLATRINRTIVDQLQNKLPKRDKKETKVTVCCAQDELQELGAQMIGDLFESDGWDVRFLGGGLSNDDIYVYEHYYDDRFHIIHVEPMGSGTADYHFVSAGLKIIYVEAHTRDLPADYSLRVTKVEDSE